MDIKVFKENNYLKTEIVIIIKKGKHNSLTCGDSGNIIQLAH